MKRSIPSSFGSLTNPRRRGVTIVLVGVFMPVLLGFAVLSIDVGYIHNLHAETQNLADAAAFAGGSALGGDDQSLVYSRAKDIFDRFAKSYPYISMEDSKIQIGRWDTEAGKFTPSEDGTGSAVRVLAVRKEVPLFFAGIFGKHHITVARDAVVLVPGSCRGIWGLEEVTVPGTPITDSYDSTEGPYNNLTAYENGDICSGGPITVSGNTEIRGDVMAAPGYPVTTNGSALNITGDISEWSGVLDVPAVDFGDAAYVNDNATIGLTDRGTNSVVNDSLRIQAGDNLTLAPGTYYFDTVEFATARGNKLPGSLTITGPTTIYITGDFNATAQGIINPTGDPHDLTLVSSGDRVGIRGGVEFYGSIFAPNARVDLVGDAHMYGAIIGRTIKMAGTFDFHVDESLEILDLIKAAGGVAVLVK